MSRLPGYPLRGVLQIPLKEISTFTAGDALSGGDVVTGFECKVAEVFE